MNEKKQTDFESVVATAKNLLCPFRAGKEPSVRKEMPKT
jgi:hypothetical protein